MTSISYLLGRKSGWSFTNDLPSLACRASIELDNVILNQDRKCDAIIDLKDLIESYISDDSGATKPRYLKDPLAETAFFRVISEEKDSPKKLEQFMERIDNILDNFKKVYENINNNEDTDINELMKVRDFCLSLSKYASALEAPIIRKHA
jgi:hypothetical protein